MYAIKIPANVRSSIIAILAVSALAVSVSAHADMLPPTYEKLMAREPDYTATTSIPEATIIDCLYAPYKKQPYYKLEIIRELNGAEAGHEILITADGKRYPGVMRVLKSPVGTTITVRTWGPRKDPMKFIATTQTCVTGD